MRQDIFASYTMGKAPGPGEHGPIITITLLSDLHHNTAKPDKRRRLRESAASLATLLIEETDLDFAKALVKALPQALSAKKARETGKG